MPPVPKIEQHADRLIAHIAKLTIAIRDLTATGEAQQPSPTPSLDARLSSLEGKLKAAENRLAALERKPLP